MTQREKLIELLKEAFENHVCGDCESFNECEECGARSEADHLIANGVVVLPCRCGECAYREDGNVLWCKHLKIGVSKDSYCSGGKRKGGDE